MGECAKELLENEALQGPALELKELQAAKRDISSIHDKVQEMSKTAKEMMGKARRRKNNAGALKILSN